MKKYDWPLLIGCILTIILIDQWTKSWALTEFRLFGQWVTPFLGFFLHKNHGVMFGSFSELPSILRNVTLATGGGFLIFMFAVIGSFLQYRLLTLRLGMAILLGGILGNVVDRIIHGPVTDFVIIKFFGQTSPAFNFADMIQWVGYFMVSYSVLKDGYLIWHEDNKRSLFWLDGKYQMKYCITFVGFCAMFSLILGIFSFTFVKVLVSETAQGAYAIRPEYLTSFIITFSLISFAFLISIFLLGMRLSHRSVGPVYAFRNFLNDLRSGKNRNFKLRNLDDFKYLEEEAKLIQKDYTHYFKLKNLMKENPLSNVESIEDIRDSKTTETPLKEKKSNTH